ncbi:MAG: hypothetical protein VX346_29205 [Planctomycetota bacterium]|nr:hypothetical protein [Planctomycetota bacterium]
MKTNAVVRGCLLAVLTFSTQWAGVGSGTQRVAAAEPVVHSSFMSPHATPIVVSEGRVFVVNTPADTVDVIDSRTHEVVARVPVGIDPVGLAARPDGHEIWVANHISDSVSVIDTDAASPTCFQVVATVQDFDPKTKATRFDEPAGIAFAGNEKAYVALSAENAIAVVDARSRRVTKRLTITAQDPRAIAVRGDRLYVIPFESNNKTQLSGGGKPLDGKLKTFDAYEHSIRVNNVLSLGHVVDIVKHPQVPDRDLYVFDTRSDRLVEVVDTLGTLLYGLTVDSNGRVFVAQTDARNDANGKSGTQKHGLKELENRAFLNQVTRVTFQDGAPQEPEFIELEPLPPHHPKPGQALATPYAIEVTPDDATLFVTAAGSDKLFSVHSDSGEVMGRADVGAVPRGIALESTADGRVSHAWVFNAVANTVSLVDVADPAALSVIAAVRLEDPTDADVKRGRIAFNTAAASTTGTYSCASCHPDGHTDQLLWVLNTPVVTGGNQIMPRSTMPVRGLRDTEPYHWDGIPGDPYGGNNSANIRENVEPNSELGDPESSARHLIDGGLANTMMRVGDLSKNDEGKSGNLSASERDAMAKFILSVTYPPAQRRAYTNVVSRRAREGFELFHVKGDVERNKPRANVCGDCHRMPFLVSTNTPGTGMDAPTWRGAYDRWLILPQGRLNIIDFDFFRRIAERGTPERRVWQMSWGSRRRFNPVWDMVLENSTGFSGAFGRQVTLSRDTIEAALTTDLLDALERAAREGAVVLQGRGVFLEDGQGTPVKLQFDPRQDSGVYMSLDDPARTWASARLRSLAVANAFLGTFTAGLADEVDFDHPQPALWTLGSIESQRGRQQFPVVRAGQMALVASGRHVREEAGVFVDGRRVAGTVRLDEATVSIELEKLPTAGMHLLQVQNPGGLFSNDFIFYAAGDDEDMDVSGTWQVAVESRSRPRRPHQHTLRISREDGQWTLEYLRSRSEGERASDVKLSGSELSFTVPRDGNVTGVYRGTVAGDFISGSLEYRAGERVVGRRDFSGARQTR